MRIRTGDGGEMRWAGGRMIVDVDSDEVREIDAAAGETIDAGTIIDHVPPTGRRAASLGTEWDAFAVMMWLRDVLDHISIDLDGPDPEPGDVVY